MAEVLAPEFLHMPTFPPEGTDFFAFMDDSSYCVCGSYFASQQGYEAHYLSCPVGQQQGYPYEYFSSRFGCKEVSATAEDLCDDAEVRCLCGATSTSGYAGLWIQCSNGACGVWVHGACIGIQSKKEVPPPYRCERCAQLSDSELELMQQQRTTRARAASAAQNQAPPALSESAFRSHSLPELPLQEISHAVPSSPESKRRSAADMTASSSGTEKKDERLRKRRTSAPDALAGASAEDLARIEEEKRERRREKDRIRKRIQRERQRREKMEKLSRAQQSGLYVDTDCSMPELDLTVNPPLPRSCVSGRTSPRSRRTMSLSSPVLPPQQQQGAIPPTNSMSMPVMPPPSFSVPVPAPTMVQPSLQQDWPAAPLAVSPEPRFPLLEASGSGSSEQHVAMFPPGTQGWIATALEEWRSAGASCEPEEQRGMWR